MTLPPLFPGKQCYLCGRAAELRCPGVCGELICEDEIVKELEPTGEYVRVGCRGCAGKQPPGKLYFYTAHPKPG